MRYTYEVLARVDLSIFPSIDKVLTEVNTFMAGFGFHEKAMFVNDGVGIYEVSSSRELTTEEQGKILAAVIEEVSKHEALKKFKIKEIRLKA